MHAVAQSATLQKKVIVNADDFGLTHRTNLGIVEAHRKGIVTSTSLLPNGVAFESAVALARAEPTLSVGIHLNLTEGQPVAEVGRLPSLLTRERSFSGPLALAAKILTGKVQMAEVEWELRAQIEKVLAAGIEVTHLDGHHHFHVFPPVFSLVVHLAQGYRIKGVRCPRESRSHFLELVRADTIGTSRLLTQYVRGRMVSFLSRWPNKKLQGTGLRSPEHFYGLTQTGFLDTRSLRRILCELRGGTSEIMCHPGYAEATLGGTPSLLVAPRQKELEALTAPEIRDLAGELGIELISYKDLG